MTYVYTNETITEIKETNVWIISKSLLIPFVIPPSFTSPPYTLPQATTDLSALYISMHFPEVYINEINCMYLILN